MPRGPGGLVLAITLGAGLVGMELLRLPIIARFEVWQFADYGANLTTQALVDRGERPAVDFFYPYGLLPIAVARAWYAPFGRTPGAYLLAVGLMHGLAGWGLARIVSRLRAGWIGAGFVLVALPYTFPPTYPNWAHGLEAALLTWALGEQAGGRRDRALALAGLAALSKPSMAYVFGALLMSAQVAADRGRAAGLLKMLRLAGLVCGPVVLGLVAVFGWESVLRSQWPGTTADLYKHAGYGFFRGSGRQFWVSGGQGWRFYVGTARGYWLAATGVLLICGLGAVVRRARGSEVGAAGEVAATCAGLHVAFICLFFGGEYSWVNYAYLLAVGVVAGGAMLGRKGVYVFAVLGGLALLADRGLRREILDGWRGVDARVGGLWTESASAAEWARVLERVGGQPAALLAMSGCGELTYADRFAPPVGIFLLNGMDETRDVRRKAEQVRRAEVVVVPKVPAGALRFRLECPAFREALAGKEVTLDGRWFLVFLSRSRVTSNE